MDRDDILRALVKPPQWQEGGAYGGSTSWLSFNEKGRFCYGVDLGGIFYMQTPDGEREGFPTLAAAQAAAEADYRTRIGAALDMEKVEKLVEAAKLLGRWCADNIPPDETMDRHLHDLDTALAAFRGQP